MADEIVARLLRASFLRGAAFRGVNMRAPDSAIEREADAWVALQADALRAALTPPPRLTSEQVEAAAKALWKIGNARIGERSWGSVAAHYIAEATVALEAAQSVGALTPPQALGEDVIAALAGVGLYPPENEGEEWSLEQEPMGPQPCGETLAEALQALVAFIDRTAVAADVGGLTPPPGGVGAHQEGEVRTADKVVLPDDKVRYVLDAPKGEARIAVVRLNDGDWPGLCILANAAGSVGLCRAIEAAALGKVLQPDGSEREATDEDRKVWKELARTLLTAMASGMQ